jgi:hypothetical protein
MFELNQIGGLGSTSDRAETITIIPDRAITYAELDVLYVENHVVSDFADLIVGDVESATNLRNATAPIELSECFLAQSKARLYGWSFLVFDGSKLKSLSPQECAYDFDYYTQDKVTKVIDLYADKEYYNFELVQFAKTVGKTADWQLGDRLGISPVRRFWKDALRYQLLSNIFTNIMLEKKVSRLGVEGLFDRLNDPDFMVEMAQMTAMRDVLGLDLFDAKTMKFHLEEKSIQYLDQMLSIYMDILAGATDYPKARLFNLSPEGQSSGNWEDGIWNLKMTKEFGKIVKILNWALAQMGLANVQPYLNKELGIEELCKLVAAQILTPEDAKVYLDNYLN